MSFLPFERKLRHFSFIQRSLDEISRALFIFGILLFCTTFLTLLDIPFHFPVESRTVFFIILFITMIVVTIIKWGKLLVLRKNLHTTVAALDKKLKTGDLFINAIQLSHEAKGNPFIEALLAETEKKLSKTDLSHALNTVNLKKNSRLFLIAFIAILIPSLFFPRIFFYSAVRMMAPWSDADKMIVKINYKIFPGNIRWPAGQDVPINLSTSDNLISCVIYYKSGQKNYLSEEMPLAHFSGSNHEYSFILRDINRDIQYYIEMVSSFKQTIVSSSFKILVIKPPVINSLRLRLVYPSYTGLEQTIQEENGHVEALKGTTVYWSAQASAPLSKANLIFGKDLVKCRISKDQISCSFIVDRDTDYFSRIIDLSEISNIIPVIYSIRLLDDAKPKVDFIKPGRNIDIPDDMKVMTEIHASDDIRIHSLKFAYYIVRPYSGVTEQTNFSEISISPDRDITAKYEFLLNGLGLSPGDTVYYIARVDDGYPFDNSHKISSDVYSIKFPSMSDLLKQVDSEEEQTINNLQSIRDRQEEYSQKIQELQKQLDRGGSMDYVAKKQLESILEKQKELTEQTKNVSQDLDKTADKLEKNNMASKQIVDKMREIEKIMQEIATKEMKESMDKLQESVKNMELSEKDKQNLAAKLDQQEMIRKLDNTLKMLKEARQNRKLKDLSRRAEDLLKNQNEINKSTSELQTQKKMDESKLTPIQNKQSENQKALDNLKQEMEKMAQENRDIDKKFSKQIQEAISLLEQKQTSAKMNKANDHLSQKDLSSAKQDQESVTQDLNDLDSKLRQGVQNKENQNTEKLYAAFDRIIFNLMAIATEQADISSAVRKQDAPPFAAHVFTSAIPKDTSTSYPDTAEKQQILGKRIIAEKKEIRQEFEKFLMVPEEFYKQFDQISDQMQIVVKYLEENNPYLAERVSAASLQMQHTLILQILDIYDNIQDQMKSSKKQGMGEAMEKMSGDQMDLNNATQQLLGQSSKEGMSPQMQEYLKELAFQQEMIRSAFDDTINNNKEEAGKLLGNMSSLSKDLEETAKKMNNGELSQEIVDKQKKILKNLLDSQKSLKTKEESPERKAEHPVKEIHAASPKELQEKKTEDNRLLQKQYKKEKYPSEYSRTIENYFKLLNNN